MALIVQKYGGTSLGTQKRILRVAQNIAKIAQKGHDLVIVVSAMGHSTDRLIAQALKIAPCPPSREMDMLLTAGERISMALLSIALFELNVKAISLTGSQSGIITNNSHRRAKIKKLLPYRILKHLEQKNVVIVAGFQGVSEETKEVTTLGRGGSDTTAVALAAALKASSVEIYTDVKGVFSANPKMVLHPRFLPKLSADQMAAFAFLGAQVLHPRSVVLAKQYRILVKVKKAFGSGVGSQIMNTLEMEQHCVTGVTSDETKLFLQCQFSDLGSIGLFCDAVAKADLNIFGLSLMQDTLWCFGEKECLLEWKALFQKLPGVKVFHIHENLIPVSLVGQRFSENPQILNQAIQILRQEQIGVLGFSVQPFFLMLVVDQNQEKKSVQLLHQHFIEGAL